MKRLRTFTFKEAFVKKKAMIQRLKCRIDFVDRDAAYAKVLYEDASNEKQALQQRDQMIRTYSRGISMMCGR
jgi:hypothetical protein